MQNRYLTYGLMGVALAAGAMMISSARAETVTYKVALQASQEVPPTTSTGSGTATVTFDTSTKQLSWTINYLGLTGPITAAHFHGPAEPGKNASVVVPIPGTASPLDGTATLTDAQAAELTSGKWYINVHTAANKGGEIRGQVVKK